MMDVNSLPTMYGILLQCLFFVIQQLCTVDNVIFKWLM